MKQEKTGTVFALIQAALWGLFPIITNLGTQKIPPIFFAAISSLLGGLTIFIILAFQNKLAELKKKNGYKYIALIIFLDIVIPFTLFFSGTKMTSALNASVLLLAEIIFTLIFTPFIGEKNNVKKLLGASFIFCGAFLILYKGNASFNGGDLLIIVSTMTYPLANYYSKKALNIFSAQAIIFFSFFFGGIFLFLISMLSEPPIEWKEVGGNHIRLLFLNGVLLLGIGKILWFESFKRLDVSKAIILGFTFPLFTILILTMFFHQPLSFLQSIGIAIMAVGIFFNIWRESVPKELTKYALLKETIQKHRTKDV